jgi:hypothetical protein
VKNVDATSFKKKIPLIFKGVKIYLTFYCGDIESNDSE